jgi:uncharacterized membrane protein HdeD (DUF308 family)
MTLWIVVAVVGVILSVFGFIALLRRFRRGEIRGRYLLAFVVGYVALISFAVLEAFRPTALTGPVTIAVLLPAFIAIGVIVRELRRPVASNDSTGQGM